MLSYRNDLVDTIKPFFQNLNNNNNTNKNNIENFNINEEKHMKFLRLLPSSQLELLYKFDIIDEKKYIDLISEKKLSTQRNVSATLNTTENIINKIIEDDKLEEMQRLIREKGIKSICPIKKSFNEVKEMKISIIIECIIQKATKCFKYLLHYAALNNLNEMNKLLISKGADINAIDSVCHIIKGSF